jgi:hypothetical protein
MLVLASRRKQGGKGTEHQRKEGTEREQEQHRQPVVGTYAVRFDARA